MPVVVDQQLSTVYRIKQVSVRSCAPERTYENLGGRNGLREQILHRLRG